MNREIKFRGKSEDEWVYGMLLKVNEGETEYGEPYNYLIQTDEKEYGEYEEYFITDDNTIGQFTGLHDKKGKEIYEGDIIKITEKEKISKHKVIPMKPIIASIEWSEEYLTYVLITTSIKDVFESVADYLEEYDIEVIRKYTRK